MRNNIMRDNNILYFIPKYLNFLDFLNLYFHQISRRKSFIEILLLGNILFSH